MGFVSNIATGLLGGMGGAGFQAAAPNIQQPFSAKDVQAQNAQAQQALAQQQAFTNALATGQGLQGGAANLQNTYGQLGQVASGQGPNPAMAALQQATGQNVANQAALMAGQRGTGSNAGMLARQAAQQGGALQQQAAGQGATLQAQQSLNALGQMGGIAGQQAGMQQSAIQGMTGAQQQQQQLQQNMLQAQNAANVQATEGANKVNQAMAAQKSQSLGGLLGGAAAVLGGPLTGLLGLNKTAGFNPSTGEMLQKFDPYSGMANVDPRQPQLAQGETSTLNASGIPTPTANMGPAQAPAGFYPQPAPAMSPGSMGTSGPINQYASNPGMPGQNRFAEGGAVHHGLSHLLNNHGPNGPMAPQMEHKPSYAHGGKVDALVSPGEVYLPPKAVAEVKKGKDPIEAGKKIPGKPKHPGNDYRNDVVPKKLEEGGVVIPNEVLQSKNPHWAAHKFVSALMAKGQLKGKK